MLKELFGLYVQGLILSSITVLIICCLWTLLRARSKKDKTASEKQTFLYEMITIAIILIPIVSFAYMSILIVLKS
ncbi:DUF4059 family protein [Streptococcus hongkongensis]|nr:amino acid ABC transporter [Streptococcus uberis]